MAKWIFLVGIDGSGKTTHALRLLRELNTAGLEAKYVYMRGSARLFLTIPFLVLMRLLGFIRTYTSPNGLKVSIHFFSKNKAAQVIYPIVVYFDACFYTFFLLYIPTILSNHLTIVDRCVIDTLIDTVADLINFKILKRYRRLFLKLVPTNSVIVLFDIDEKLAMNRKKDIPTLQYLKLRRRLYLKLAKLYNWAIVNTNFDFKTAHQKLLWKCYKQIPQIYSLLCNKE